MCTLIFPTDNQTAGRQVCAWSSGALLSAARKVDWTAGEASRVGAQSGTTGGKGTLQLLSDLTSCIALTARLALPIHLYWCRSTSELPQSCCYGLCSPMVTLSDYFSFTGFFQFAQQIPMSITSPSGPIQLGRVCKKWWCRCPSV